MQGRYKVKSPDLKPLHERATKISRQLQYFAIEHIRRELNRDADALANVALDSAGVPKFEDRKSRLINQTASAPARPTQAPAPSRPNPPGSLRARFVKGVFVPADPVDLAEGSEVTLDVRIPLNK
jgi:ribonuclease HI